jgi:four helix bundle protein
VSIRKYSDLVVWNEGLDLSEEIYRVTESFPSHERYALSIQMRRAAMSIPSNIAEGYCRFYTREYWRFVTIALGSLAELETQLEMAKRLGYLGDEESQKATEMASTLGRRLQTLRKALHKKINPPTSP